MSNDNTSSTVLIASLRERGSSMHSLSVMILLLMLLALSLGIYVFVFADKYSYFGPAAGEARSRDDALGERTTTIAETYEAVAKTKAQLEELQKTKPIDTKAIDLAKSDLSHYQASLRDLNKANDVTRAAIDMRGKETAVAITSFLSTRIGAIVILLFLVQILVSIYRYSLRLEAFYHSRADIIELHQSNSQIDLEHVAAIFDTEKVDFGRTPAAPIRTLVKMLEELKTTRESVKAK